MRQRRILLFVFDARGLGHLQRMSRIAEGIAGPCASLILTSQRAAAWIVPASCAFVSIPSHQQLSAARSARHGAECWLDLPEDGARTLRRRFIAAVADAFEPDLVMVDYLPLGRREELDGLLQSWTARKVLLHRGIIDPHDLAHFEGRGREAMERDYDRILVTADPRTSELPRSYQSVAHKVQHVGYVAPERRSDRMAIRRERGVPPGKPWVVCSAGAGVGSQELMNICVRAASVFPDARFDIITGPLAETVSAGDTNAYVIRETAGLPRLHAAADFVINQGGYNSLMEAMSGGARMIVHAPPDARSSEPRIHAERLSRHYPIDVVQSEDHLMATLRGALAASEWLTRASHTLDVDGVANIREIVLDDLHIREHVHPRTVKVQR
jgi:predicted glycosyltransferase